MIKELRLFLRENGFMRKWVYPFVRWVAVDLLKVKQHNIRRFGYEAVSLIDEAAQRVGAPYCAFYGTLLGFIRDKGFIPHDMDMDFAIMPDSKKVSSLFYALESLGFYFERYILIDGKLKEFSMRYKEISIDFFLRYYLDEAKRMFKSYGERVGDYWIVVVTPVPTRLIPYEIKGVKTMIPENFDEILTACYGNWHIKVKDWDDRKSPLVQKEYATHKHYISRSREDWIKFLQESKI